MPGGQSTSIGSVVAHRRRKVHEELSLAVLRGSRAKGVAQKVETLVFVAPMPVVILAVDDLRLLGMRFQLAPPQTLFDLAVDELRLSPRSTVDNDIIRITLERDVRKILRHPLVEYVMQEDIGQQRRHDTALGRAAVPTNLVAFRVDSRHFQPTLDVKQNPRTVGVFPHRVHHQ